MRSKAKKMVLLSGILCVLGITVCGCQGAKEMPEAEEQQADTGEPVSEGTSEDEKEIPEAGEAQGENPDENDTSGTWTDTDADLEGDIKNLEDGKFTVIEAIQEELDGGEIMIGLPAEGGDDSDFNKVTVIYDEDTLFAVRTIYDGGARYEMEEAASSDLAAGQMVEVWGSVSNGEMKATQICIIKVEM